MFGLRFSGRLWFGLACVLLVWGTVFFVAAFLIVDKKWGKGALFFFAVD